MLNVLLCVIWIAQLLIEVLTFGIIWKLEMLPTLYMTVAVAETVSAARARRFTVFTVSRNSKAALPANSRYRRGCT